MCIQGVPPATLTEFTLSGSGNVDYYDGMDHMYHDVVPHVLNDSPVSLVDGYNLPVRINNNVGCGVPSCPVDLGPNCMLSSFRSVMRMLNS